MQKISPIHNLILQVRQILGSYELNGHTIFDPAQPKIIESTFSSPEFQPACKKTFHSIYSFLRYCQFLSPVTRLATPIFEHAQHKRFFINFKFMGICINMQKITQFHSFVLEIWLIKQSCNLIGWEHFGPYKIFPHMRFVQEHIQ